MNELKIRRATSFDADIISALGIATCYEAYFELDPSKDLAEYCVNFFSPPQIAAELEDANSTFLIAEWDGKAIGYAKLREGRRIECLKNADAIEVQRIYLLEKMKGRNFGRALLEKCFAVGAEKNYETLWLGVWEKNVAAQKFYERLGMRIVGTADFSDGKNEFVNLVYAKEI